MTLLRFDVGQALCACGCLADTLQGGDNLDFLCRIESESQM